MKRGFAGAPVLAHPPNHGPEAGRRRKVDEAGDPRKAQEAGDGRKVDEADDGAKFMSLATAQSS
jgi:hypothetical protein